MPALSRSRYRRGRDRTRTAHEPANCVGGHQGTSARCCRGDRNAALQGRSERCHFRMGVRPMSARRAMRDRKTEPQLTRPQGARAHIQQGGGFGRRERVHVREACSCPVRPNQVAYRPIRPRRHKGSTSRWLYCNSGSVRQHVREVCAAVTASIPREAPELTGRSALASATATALTTTPR